MTNCEAISVKYISTTTIINIRKKKDLTYFHIIKIVYLFKAQLFIYYFYINVLIQQMHLYFYILKRKKVQSLLLFLRQ